jgi:small redox-active disulfide protein 2
MMTPVLVLGRHLLHQGSVPERRKVREWIQEYFGKPADRNDCQHTVEVLGPGCPKCDTLYDNTRQAVARSGLDDRVSIRKRTDIAYFQEMGVSVTPSLVVNRIVVSKGKVLTVDQVAEQLDGHLST